MKSLNLLWIRSALLTLAASTSLVACGDEGKPVPGNADPCDTPMAGVLGCPADSQMKSGTSLAAVDGPFTVGDACQKLVACGILAAEHFGARGKECGNAGDCPTGECRANDEGARHCYFHRLDHFWCVAKFSSPGDNRCDNEDDYTDSEVAAIVDCIARSPCASLGLPLTEKLDNSDSEVDRYICNDGETKVSTATTCDQGLLIYR